VASASSPPATTAAVIPNNPSVVVTSGPAPSDRSTSASSAFACSCREMIWMAMRIAASAVITPKTPSAMASGPIALWVSVSMTEAT
jgi:hypothetical protein